ncbi:putative transcription initiation factor iie subunit beta protein [Phaeoacremonium minimum UCRPA7]|uniref:Transcription initiation factor IIE subunit beta n=1 Tax=Phaeoacremonium minimum (strain UCR-PA7) TaxID=1286976 RepID=R8BR69_PHAM7|nr:putative transcription initiation factor iie subunit beta protein [Phaeoacremonium minimum UCRPA7]EOO01800.1 putative transcription initiation factor iie subunit beta protein [Phaeoacremonium minimum UCRPA7]
MSSFLERQQAAFSGSLASAASKISGGAKRPLAPPSPSPSVASTTSAAPGASGSTPTKNNKSKRPDGATIYSQPENTGVGTELGTNMLYAVQNLKEKDRPLTLAEIVDNLSVSRREEAYHMALVDRLRNNPRIQWVPDPKLSEQTWKSGTYVHRPIIPNVKNKVQLLGFLQKKKDANGVAVKDLKDGWPSCEDAIGELEREHKILVVRTKKDNHPRMVWIDDASLWHPVDPEFQNMWHKVEVPSLDDIVRRLSQVGQKPTSEDPRLKKIAAPKVEKKKKRAVRRSGKTTNTHMEHLLKDFANHK